MWSISTTITITNVSWWQDTVVGYHSVCRMLTEGHYHAVRLDTGIQHIKAEKEEVR